MRTGTLSIASLAMVLFTACSSGDSGGGTPPTDSGAGDAKVGDSAKGDVSSDGTSEAASDTGVVDTGKPDTNVDDTPTGITFSCGSEKCSATFQYCKQTGACAAPDAGSDTPSDVPGDADAGVDATPTDAGDAGACTSRCESLPSECFGGASCTCILNKVCGSPSSGTCDETPSSAFTVECAP